MSIKPHRRQRGMTLIELIVFMVIVSVALAGVLTVLNLTVRSSADPMIRKQMLAIAEGLLEEVTLRPFTWCDPDDPVAATANSAAACATSEAMGPEAGETRSGGILFDNVNDYNGLAGITTNITGAPMPPGYTAAITVAPTVLNSITLASGAALLITVTVSFNNENLVIEGYRTRYAPNSSP